MYFEDKKIVNVDDGIDGYKRVTLEVSINKETNEPVVENWDIPSWELSINSAEEPIDATTARNNRAIILVDSIYDVLKEKNAKINDLGFVAQKLISKFNGVEQNAVNNLFGKDQEFMRISDWEVNQ